MQIYSVASVPPVDLALKIFSWKGNENMYFEDHFDIKPLCSMHVHIGVALSSKN